MLPTPALHDHNHRDESVSTEWQTINSSRHPSCSWYSRTTQSEVERLHSLVEVLVDFLLMRESQHATDHACVFDRPSQVADLRPAVLVLHLHYTLCDGQPLFGHGHHGPESHLLDLVLIDLYLLEKTTTNNNKKQFLLRIILNLHLIPIRLDPINRLCT